MSVTNQRQEYQDQILEVQKNRDCVVGQRKIKERGTRYLQPLSSQMLDSGTLSPDGAIDYAKYLQLALFFNATGRTVDGLTGLVFRKDPVIELPANLEYLKDSVSASNTTLISQMQTAIRDAFATPRSALLVDFPDVEGTPSRADAERLNLRPRILHFPFESIINWYFDTVNGKHQLTMIVLKESITKRIDKFQTEQKDAYRVLELLDGVYHHSLYSDEGELVSAPMPVRMNGQLADSIPLFFIEPVGGTKSVIDDLVDVNLNHYNMFASYANKEHTSGFPIFWETGVQGDDANVSIGPGAKWSSMNSEAQFGVLETSGDGGSLRQYLEDRKTEMAALGAEMLNPSVAQAESGESKRLDKVAQNATTADVANTVSRAYQQAAEVAATWNGDSANDVEIQLNTDYIPESMNPQLLSALMLALQNGDISYDTFYENLQRGEIANPERTAEDEKALIARSESGIEE